MFLANANDTVLLDEISSGELLRAQVNYKVLGMLYNQVTSYPDKFRPQYFVDDCSMDLMTTKGCHNEKDSSQTSRVCLPDSLITKAFGIAHTTHLGITKTFELVSARYFVQGLFKKVEQFVKNCQTCNRVKKLNIAKASL